MVDTVLHLDVIFRQRYRHRVDTVSSASPTHRAFAFRYGHPRPRRIFAQPCTFMRDRLSYIVHQAESEYTRKTPIPRISTKKAEKTS
ncbi:hypothetical protein OK016_06285 [Vibrio chagasii]|nr:hypothetical protein [Vibrio chagasii]